MRLSIFNLRLQLKKQIKATYKYAKQCTNKKLFSHFDPLSTEKNCWLKEHLGGLNSQMKSKSVD